MIDEPGWTVGSLSSARPAFGPEPRNLRSIAIRNKLLLSEVSVLEKSENGM